MPSISETLSHRRASGPPVRDTERAGDALHLFGPVAGDQLQRQSHGAQAADDIRCASARGRSSKQKRTGSHARDARATSRVRRRRRRDRRRSRGCPAGSRQPAWPAQPLTRMFHDALGWHYRARGGDQRSRQRMAARYGQRSAASLQIRADPDRRPAPAAVRSACRSCRTPPCRPRPTAPVRSAISAACRTRNRRPVAITCTAGTASAKAQGQVMISTALAVSSACSAGTPITEEPPQERQQAHTGAPPAHTAAPPGRRAPRSDRAWFRPPR